MCGIAGIIDFYNKKKQYSLLEQMLATIRHRGPDDEGIWSDDIATLGHRRLSIIDLSSAGHQPMTNEDASLWLTFNGEIYNYKELRDELVKAGHLFKSNTDSEVILHAYEEWGTDCLHRFNGMWAFVIWNKKKKECFASRDRFGIKPFYYFCENGKLLFASEIKALLEANIKREVNWEAFADYFSFLYTTGSKTFFANIFQLEPGHSFSFSEQKGLSIKKYWDLPLSGTIQESPEIVASNCLELLESSVNMRLRSDVPLGCYLSGGLDSSTVSALAATDSSAQVKAFTASFSEGGIYDETPYARDVVRESNLIGCELQPDMSQFWDTLPKVMYHLDQPFEGPQIFPKFAISGLASKEVKVCLGGQGGDEIFVGYPRYLMAYLEQGMSDNLFEQSFQKLKQWYRMTSIRSKGRFLLKGERHISLAQRFLHFASINNSDNSVSFSKQLLSELTPHYSPFDYYYNEIGDSNSLEGLQRYEQKTFLQGLLHVEDRVSMAWGLESRLPLLDHRIAEYMFSLNSFSRTGGYRLKGVLKDAMKNKLPKSIIGRKDKLGFPTPFRSWVKGGLNNSIKTLMSNSVLLQNGLIKQQDIDFLLNNNLNDMQGLTLWALTAFEMWHAIFITETIQSS